MKLLRPLRPYVSELERGEKRPTLLTVARLAAALDVRPSKLVRDAEGEIG